jgi:hypothetical protein
VRHGNIQQRVRMTVKSAHDLAHQHQCGNQDERRTGHSATAELEDLGGTFVGYS